MTTGMVDAGTHAGQGAQPITDGRAHWFVGQNASDQTPDTRRPERLVLTAASWTDVGAAF